MITVFLSNNFNQISTLNHMKCVRFSSKLSGRLRIKNEKKDSLTLFKIDGAENIFSTLPITPFV